MPDNAKLTYTRRLPHIQSSVLPLFITWRLNFTLPKVITNELMKMKQIHESNIQHMSPDLKKLRSYTYEKHSFEWFDAKLSQIMASPVSLTKLEVAHIITDSLNYYHSIRYDLIAYCIMPNHVHVIIQQMKQADDNPYPLSKITQSWKRHTSTQIKKLLNIPDSIWQPESYDHVIRNESELSHYLEYTMDNPVKAELVGKWQDWEFSWVNPVFL